MTTGGSACLKVRIRWCWCGLSVRGLFINCARSASLECSIAIVYETTPITPVFVCADAR